MKHFARSLVATLALASLATPALADHDRRYSSERQKQIREFFECRFTPAAHFDGTIVDAAIATEELSILKDLVIAAGLTDLLSGPGPFTVYAPLNSAFETVPAPLLSAIGNDINILTAVLAYHVIADAGRQTDPRRVFSRVTEVETFQGQSLFFNRDSNGTQINQSHLVSCTPIRTTNGVVYLIDSVLLPQFKPAD